MKRFSFPTFPASSLATQLRLVTVIPVIIVTLFFSYLYTAEAVHGTKQERLESGNAYLKQLLPTVEFALTHRSIRTLQELVQASTTHPDLQALSIYNTKKELLVYHGQPIPLPHSLSGQPQKAEKFINHTVFTPVFSPGTTSPVLGWVALKLDPHPIQITYYKHLLISLFIGLFGLLCTFFMQMFLNKKILHPLARLRRSMKQILRNEFETEIKCTSTGIIKDIEEGSNHLQKHYLDSVYDLNHQIEVATADLQQSLELLEEKNIELSLDKRKTEEKIVQQSEFIANMSHEIRTPMNGIIGFTNVLLDTQLNILQKDYVNTIKSSSHDLLNIINDILDYSKIDAGKLSLEQIPLNLRYTLDEVLTLAAPIANKKQLDLIACADVQVPTIVVGDPLRMKQILQNLVTNAVKFTETGHVLIKICVQQEHPNYYELVFIVSDTGIGISQEDRARLFHAFYQVDAAISSKFGGSGLGLVICKKLTEAMGGQISVESQPQHGTSFTVRLPLKKLPAYEQERKTPKLVQPKKILCLDSNALSLQALEQTLLALNYTPIGLCELSMLPLVLAEHPDIQLTICSLHDTQDFDLELFLKQHPFPCLILSKSPLPPHLPHPVAILHKPLQTQKLEEKLNALLYPLEAIFPTSSQLEHLRQTLKLQNPALLIAEDNPVNRLLLETLLSPYCQITVVPDGEAAVQACLYKQYDMVLLDLQMPKRSGQNVANYLRKELQTYKTTPILFISANATDIDEKNLTELQIKKCLQKPVDEETLLHEILTTLTQCELPAIDWEKCLKNLSGNIKLANTCFSQFIEELQQNKITFKALIKSKDLHGIGDLAHMLKGACGFLAVPQLKQLAHEIEMQSKTQSMTQLKVLFKPLYAEMDRVVEAYEALKKH
jgi:two-component system sensor histidine kinase BarA